MTAGEFARADPARADPVWYAEDPDAVAARLSTDPDHGLSEHRDEVNQLVDHWLDSYVRDGQAWPSLEPHGR